MGKRESGSGAEESDHDEEESLASGMPYMADEDDEGEDAERADKRRRGASKTYFAATLRKLKSGNVGHSAMPDAL